MASSPYPRHLDLDAIEARAGAATPGPWGPFQTSSIAGQLNPDAGFSSGSWMGYGKYADAEFIAHAREDVPALISRIRELEAALQPFAQAVWYSTRPPEAADPEWKTRIDQEHWDNAGRVLPGQR